jgi:hypothetical protein
MQDEASKGASVQTGLSEVSPIEKPGPEFGTTGKDQKPTPNPKGPIAGAMRPGNPKWR